MDALLPAVAGDLIGRLVSFLIGKYLERGTSIDIAVRLQRALLQACVIVEEAESRQIANRAMLQQLNKLRQELCRATYEVDVLRWRATNSSRSRGSHTRPPPSSNILPIVMVQSLEAALSDMRELVVLLISTCPRVSRQPYCAYLFMESCMFGRQMEKEHIIGFLLRPSHHQDLDVLPVIGLPGVGKRTLVEHACLDERVRLRFTSIRRLRSDALVDLPSHEHHRSVFDFSTCSLTVIDMIDGDADAEEAWRRFHSAVCRRANKGSKIIVISRTEAHASMETVPPLRLHLPRREELWCFFRALAFGAADPDERPDLTRITMSLCACIRDFSLFASANVIVASLRADLSACSWRRVHKVFSEETALQLGAIGHGYLCRPVKNAPHAFCLMYNLRKLIGMARSELPKLTKLGMLNGTSVPPTEDAQFDVLVWQSRIPPYASYVATWDTDRGQQYGAAAKKRLLNKRRRAQEEYE